MVAMGILAKARQNRFYFNSGLFGLLSLGGAIFNYALYPVLSHILNPTSFGNFTVILALSNQILAILLAFNITSIYLVKNYSEDEAREISQIIQKVLVWFFALVTLLAIVISPWLKSKLKIDSPMAFGVLGLMLVSTIPAVIWTGYLQGHRRLVKVGLYTFSGSLMKFALAIALSWKWGFMGALWGVLLGTVCGIIILKTNAGMRLPHLSSVFIGFSSKERIVVKRLRGYIAQAIFVVGGLGILQNIDITYAKHFFTPHTAGIYSGISILSNALYYVAFLLVWIILPEIEPKDRLINRRVLGSAYKLLGIVGGLALAFELVFRHRLGEILLGSDFGGQGIVLVFATLFQLSLVAVVLYAFYLLVIRSRRAVILGVSVIAPCILMPWFWHNSPRQLITALWMAVLIGIGIYSIISSLVMRFHEEN